MIPLFVCVRATLSQMGDYGASYSTADFRDAEPIGYLRGFEINELEIGNVEMVERDLAPLGLKVRYLFKGVKAEHGCLGALIALAVAVPTYEAAERLPGFVALGHWTKAIYLPPKEGFNPTFNYPADDVDGIEIKRCDVRDAYDDFEPPLYNEEGVFTLSMIPRGQLATYVFLREDPTHIYVSMSGAPEKAELISAARKLFSKGV